MPPEKRLDETTGPMEFDETGQRTAFRLKLLEFNTDKLIEIGYYNEDGVTITRSEKEREADVAKKITTSYRVTSRVVGLYYTNNEKNSTPYNIVEKEKKKKINIAFSGSTIPDGVERYIEY